VAREEGNLDDIRAVLGNDKAIKSYREGKLPFPEGAIIARLAWSYDPSEENNKFFGQPQSFVAGHPKNGVSVYGQSPPSRQYSKPAFLPPGGCGSRPCLHPLRTLARVYITRTRQRRSQDISQNSLWYGPIWHVPEKTTAR